MEETTDKVDHEEKLVYKEMSTWNLVSVFFDNTSGTAELYDQLCTYWCLNCFQLTVLVKYLAQSRVSSSSFGRLFF